MTIKLRALRLRVTTDGPDFGAEFRFGTGLNVIAGGGRNTQGKSTCLLGILYALGCEGMLSPKKTPPFAAAMLSEIDAPDGSKHRVVSSRVELEIESVAGEPVTLRRFAKHPEASTDLVSLFHGRRITGEDAGRQVDLFVRQPGAAQRESGFHFQLARIIGWDLPSVPRAFGDDEIPLYIEALFPFLFIEQKEGWSGIGATLPTYLPIREIGSRALEFLLNLNIGRNAALRASLRAEEVRCVSAWREIVGQAKATGGSVGGSLEGFPSEPTTELPPKWALVLLGGDEPVDASAWLSSTRASLSEMRARPVPSAEVSATKLEDELQRAEDRLERALSFGRERAQALQARRVELAAVERRLAALREDLQRNKDTEKLVRLGSQLSYELARDECPTCHQSVSGTLLPAVQGMEPMSVAANLDLIEQQIEAFDSVRRGTEAQIEQEGQRLAALRERVDDLRRRIRAMKRSLAADSAAPSEAAIYEIVRLEQRASQVESALSELARLRLRVEELRDVWGDLLRRREVLKGRRADEEDLEKLGALEQSVRAQLGSYGFKSFRPAAVEIRRATYRPGVEAYDLNQCASASDLIRLIWAYTLGLLETARVKQTNHPGIVIMDEPRQQSADEESFRAFLARASLAESFGQQVIVATSENRAVLDRALLSLSQPLGSLAWIDGWALKPVEADA